MLRSRRKREGLGFWVIEKRAGFRERERERERERDWVLVFIFYFFNM